MHLPGPSRPRVSSDNHDDLFRRIATAETPEDYKAIVDYIKSKRKFALICDNGLNGPLHHAIRHRKFQLLYILLSMEILPVNLVSTLNVTPLQLGLTDEVPIQVLEKLIAAGADVNTPNIRGQTPLHSAMKCDYRYAHLLIRHGALEIINSRDLSGRTPLHYAVTERNFDNVSLLLYYDADANIADNEGLTPFMLTNFFPGDSCNIQDTLLEYENAFLLEKDDYDVDNFTESRLYKILRICIRHRNLDLFKRVWSRVSPEIIGLIPELSPELILHAPFDFVDFLLRNDYIDLTKILNLCPAIEDLYATFSCDDKEMETFVNTVYLFLSYGGIFSVGDFQFLQRFQHYEAVKELIRVFLFMDIDKSFQRRVHDSFSFPYVPYIIPYVMCNINEKFEDIIDDYCHRFFFLSPGISFILEETEENMQQFFRFSSSDKLLKLYKDCLIPPLGCLLEIREMNVPSLIELSRNRVKDRICEKYKIKNACQFYTTLEYLPMIPRKVKDIIAFRTPIYEKADGQIIKFRSSDLRITYFCFHNTEFQTGHIN